MKKKKERRKEGERWKDRARRIGKGSCRQRDKGGIINGGCRENHKFRVHTLDASHDASRLSLITSSDLTFCLRGTMRTGALCRYNGNEKNHRDDKLRRGDAYIWSRCAGARQRLTQIGPLNKYSLERQSRWAIGVAR